MPFLRGIKEVSWNFSEKAHEKGAPDGVGGSIKRSADAFVHQGGDIQCPQELFSFLEKSSSTVKFKWISEDDILLIDEAVPNALPVVKGTLGIHQITTDSAGKIFHREVSCFCHRLGLPCECGTPSFLDFSSGKDASSTTTEELVGKMVIVKYDEKPFVGQVQKVVGEEIEVSCMRQMGKKNTFTWPEVSDVIFYFQSDVKAIISEPEPSTSRSSRLLDEDWDKFLSI